MGFRSGFTLLEVLVALAILSIVLVAAVKHSGSSVDNAVYLREKTLAHWVAMNKAAEIQLLSSNLPVGTTNGEVSMANREWFWRVLVEKTPDAAFLKAVIEVMDREESTSPLTRLVVFVGQS